MLGYAELCWEMLGVQNTTPCLIVVPGLCCRLRLGLRLRLGFGLLCFGLRNRNLQLPLGPSREKGLREFLPTGTAIGREPWTPVVHNFRFLNFLELRFWCRDRRDPSIFGCLGWRFGCFGCSTFARLRLGSAGRSGTGSLGSLGSGRSPGRGSLPRWNQWGIVIVVRVADFRIWFRVPNPNFLVDLTVLPGTPMTQGGGPARKVFDLILLDFKQNLKDFSRCRKRKEHASQDCYQSYTTCSCRTLCMKRHISKPQLNPSARMKHVCCGSVIKPGSWRAQGALKNIWISNQNQGMGSN